MCVRPGPEMTERAIEVFHNGKRITTHVRSSFNRKHTKPGERPRHHNDMIN